jgi:carbon-monoxide dehydrogenase large subunit
VRTSATRRAGVRQRPGRAPHRGPGPGAGPGPLHRRRGARRASSWRSCAARWRMAASSPSTSTPRAPRRAWWPSTPAPTWWPPASSPSATAPAFKRPDGQPMAAPPKRALAHEVVRYVGEPVVAVVADTRAPRRKAAADAVFVETEDLPVNVDPLRALQPGAPVLWEGAPDNISAEMRHGDAAAAEAAFARRRTACRWTWSTSAWRRRRWSRAACWPGSTDGRLTVRLSSQMPTGVRGGLADAMGLTTDNVRVLVGDVGGGFGMKTGIYPEDIAVGYAALHAGRPVKWQAERLEDFTSAVHGRDVSPTPRWRSTPTARCWRCACARWPTWAPTPHHGGGDPAADRPLGVDQHLRHPDHRLPVHRGADQLRAHRRLPRRRPARGDLHHRAADGRGGARDRIDGRAAPAQHDPPRADALHQPDGADLRQRPLRADPRPGPALADWHGFAARRREPGARPAARPRHRHLPGMDRRQRLRGARHRQRHADGFIEIGSATQAMGQGIATSYAQLAVDVFGVPIERVRIVQGDTDRGQRLRQRRQPLAVHRRLGGAAWPPSARSTRARKLAADALEAPAADIEYRAGRFTVAGTDLGIDLFELAGRQADQRIFVDSTPPSAAPPGPTAATSARSRSTPPPARCRSWPTPRSTTSAASSAR